MRITVVAFLVMAQLAISGAVGAQVTKETVPGISNFSRVETTIACAGATTPAAVADVKRLGYRSIINLRLANEQGAQNDAEAIAARAAGINYIWLPFNSASPDVAIVDQFLREVAAPANQPAFVHCASANRASALWMVKRMVIDGWDAERAGAEAAALGLSSSALQKFALDYAASHRSPR